MEILSPPSCTTAPSEELLKAFMKKPMNEEMMNSKKMVFIMEKPKPNGDTGPTMKLLVTTELPRRGADSRLLEE